MKALVLFASAAASVAAFAQEEFDVVIYGSSPAALTAAFAAKVAGPHGEIRRGLVLMVLGCVSVWSCLFGTGWLLYAAGGHSGLVGRGTTALAVAAAAAAALVYIVGRKKNCRVLASGGA